jgi:hypothetical protein
MRMRSPKTRAMVTAPEVPRFENGGIALCHICQRWTYFAGGFLKLMIEALLRPGKYPRVSRDPSSLAFNRALLAVGKQTDR